VAVTHNLFVFQGFQIKREIRKKNIPLDLMIPFPTLIGGSGEDDFKKFIFCRFCVGLKSSCFRLGNCVCFFSVLFASFWSMALG
jgi:hypothetical protein